VTTTLREVIIRNLRLRALADDLPDRVFPIDVSIELSRSKAKDSFVSDDSGRPISQAAGYPFPVKVPRQMPYVPHTTVRFTNPVESAQGNADPWDFPDFSTTLSDLMNYIEEEGTIESVDRLYIKSLRLVEIPEEYVKERTRPGVDGLRATPDAYRDNIRVGILTFDKRATVPEHVRADLDPDMAPNQVIQPMNLTEVKTVTLKEYSKARPRRKYYTPGKAQTQTDEPDVHEGDAVTWGLAQRYAPQLTGARTVVPVEWIGHERDSTEFVMESARVLDESETA